MMNKVSRIENSIRNIVFGIVYKVMALILPFIARTLVIRYLSVEYVGLSSLFTSLLDVLNLAELGVGSAIVFSMYEAIAKNDEQLICVLLKLYRKIYTIIGIIILVVGLAFLPFINRLVSGDIPDGMNLYILYFGYLSNTVLTYFLFAYKNSLFIAHQRNDIISKISSITLLLQNVLQILFLIITHNYYAYIIWMVIATFVKNLMVNYISNKNYPNYKPNGKIDSETYNQIMKKVKSLFLYKIGGVVLTSVDSIVISSFLGLSILGKYNNYFYIITSLFAFLAIFYDSLRAGVGNSIVTESKKKNKQDFDRLFLLNSWFVTWCSVCLICLYEPFMLLWVGDSLSFPFRVVILFAVYFFVWKMMEIVNLYKDAAGMWEYDKYRPIVSSILNLFLNIILVQYIGIYGILLSTIISIILVILPWSTIVLFRYYFNGMKNALRMYFFRFFMFTILAVIASVVTYFICQIVQAATIVGISMRFGICVVVPNVIILAVISWSRDFRDTFEWLRKKIMSVKKA